MCKCVLLKWIYDIHEKHSLLHFSTVLSSNCWVHYYIDNMKHFDCFVCDQWHKDFSFWWHWYVHWHKYFWEMNYRFWVSYRLLQEIHCAVLFVWIVLRNAHTLKILIMIQKRLRKTVITCLLCSKKMLFQYHRTVVYAIHFHVLIIFVLI